MAGVAGEPDPLQSLAKVVARLEEMLERLPLDVGRELKTRVATLRTLMLEKRPPALVLVGRRGAGKSSLVNALLGAKVAELGHVTAQTGRAKWYLFERAGGAVRVLDTRGMQEGSPPAEADEAGGAFESVAVELRAQAPDAIVFVAKASEVDAATTGDLDALERVYDELRRAHKVEPPLLAVITHADVLEPKATRLHDAAREPPQDVEEKTRLATLAEHSLALKIDARDKLRPRHVATIAVSSYMSWRTDGSLRADERWRIVELTQALFRNLPDAGRAELARATQVRVVQEELATTLTTATAALCAGIGAVSILPLDVVTMTALQAGMVAGIAWIGGRSVDRKGATEFIAGLGVNVGVAVGLREAVRTIVRIFLPAGGALVSAGVAFAGTSAIGAAARAYYIRGVSLDDARKMFRGSKG